MLPEDLENAPQAEEEKEPEAEVVEAELVEEEPHIEPEQDPIEVLKQEIENLNQQLALSENERKRAYADTQNTRRRLQREADLVKQYRFQSAATSLLPVLDNMESALNHVPENEEAKNFAKGFELILSQLNKVMQDEGVVEIEAKDQPFDPNWMQALMTEKVEDVEPNMVLEVLQKGYKIKDRLLRPALVKVSE